MKCYIGIKSVRLRINSVNSNLYQQAFLAPLPGNGCCKALNLLNIIFYLFILYLFTFLLLFFSYLMDSTNSIPIYKYAAPTSSSLMPPESSQPILSKGYELRPCLINMIQNQSFSGKDVENPYFHLREFEQTCACLHISGMSDETLRWKLFPFSLKGKAKRWYDQTIGTKQGDWGALRSSFCIDFFPISKVVTLRLEVLSFK